MKSAVIKTGYKCNNMCLFCPHRGGRHTIREKSLDQLLREIGQAKKTSDSMIFTGGEATIRPDFLEIVGAAKRAEFKKIIIQSNGRMFSYLKFCQDIIKAGANEFHIALHGHEARLHDYLTAIPGSFEQALRGINNLRMLKQAVAASCTVCRSNYRHLLQIMKLLHINKVNRIRLDIVNGTDADGFFSIVPRMSSVAKQVKSCLEFCDANDIDLTVKNMPYCIMDKSISPLSGRGKKGKIYACCQDINCISMIKPEKCQACFCREKCQGISSDYLKFYGEKEFKPIKKLNG